MSAALERFAPLFSPKTVAVLGASTSGQALPNHFIRRCRAFGFRGPIYPIHPSAAEVSGLPAYRSIAETPEPVDYAYISIPAAAVPEALRAARGRLRFAQVISSGFGEAAAGRTLEAEVVAAAREAGCRLLGPNCLGTHSPRGGLTFAENPPRDLGCVGVVSQSGGLGTDIIRRGSRRGLRFSGLVTIGNSADVGPADLLEFYLEDPQTRVVGLYLEDVKEGRRFFELLRAARGTKPVVVLKGGRTDAGRAAAASHTGALAGDARVWEGLARQVGVPLVATLDEFIDALLAFQLLAPRIGEATREVVLFGNGGGTSVLATDYFARLGLRVTPFGPAAIAALEALALPPGSSVTNPVDTPVGTLQQDEGRIAEKILEAIYAGARPQAIVMHLNLAAFFGRTGASVVENLTQVALRVRERHPGRSHFLLVLRSDGEPEIEGPKQQFRASALALGIPVYDEMANAAHALAALAFFERHGAPRPGVGAATPA